MLVHPALNEPFILDTDASGVAIGAVLIQERDGLERPVAFYSRKLNGAERRYSTNKRELLAIVESVKNFRVYLLSRPFRIRTDHRSLAYLGKRELESGGAIARWITDLQEYSFKIEYRKGAENVPADALSRIADAVEGEPLEALSAEDLYSRFVCAVDAAALAREVEPPADTPIAVLLNATEAAGVTPPSPDTRAGREGLFGDGTDWAHRQESDPHTGTLLGFFKSNRFPEGNELSSQSREVRAFLAVRQHLSVRNGHLYYFDQTTNLDRLVVPLLDRASHTGGAHAPALFG